MEAHRCKQRARGYYEEVPGRDSNLQPHIHKSDVLPSEPLGLPGSLTEHAGCTK